MTQKNNLITWPVSTPALAKRMLIGAAIALLLIVIFLAGAGEPNPAWPRFWMLQPLLVVPFAGAMGGAFYYFMDHQRSRGGGRKILANVLSFLVYIFGLWMGTVLGLNGTMWN
ncbi:MAG: potassium transporter KefB [Bacteroidota bacterium]